MANILRVTEMDNRGTKDIDYGFVYFSDGLRVTYTSTKTGENLEYHVGESSGGWGPITETHKRLASEYLSRSST